MSRLLALLALLLTVPAASAQSPLSDSTSIYVVPRLGFGYSAGTGQTFRVGAVVGRRLTDRTELGVRLDVGDGSEAGTALFAAFGPQLGVTGSVAGLDARAQVGAVAVVAQRALETDARGVQSAGVQADYTLARTFRSGRGQWLAPTVGVYGAACATRNAAVTPGERCAELGAISGFEFGFRAFGADVAVPLTVRTRIAGNQRLADHSNLGLVDAPIAGGIRLRF